MTRLGVYVKPVVPNTEAFGWLVMELTPWENFIDGWKRYGVWIALCNVFWRWG